jgi:hypothetical protein
MLVSAAAPGAIEQTPALLAVVATRCATPMHGLPRGT